MSAMNKINTLIFNKMSYVFSEEPEMHNQDLSWRQCKHQTEELMEMETYGMIKNTKKGEVYDSGSVKTDCLLLRMLPWEPLLTFLYTDSIPCTELSQLNSRRVPITMLFIHPHLQVE